MTPKKHTITFVPEGGLGNRMRTIVAAIRLAQLADARLDIVWFRDWGLGCRFCDLFEPIRLPDVSVREATRADLNANRNMGWSDNGRRRLKQGRTMMPAMELTSARQSALDKSMSDEKNGNSETTGKA